MPFINPAVYATQAVTWLLLFASFAAAFLAITVLGRSRWSSLGEVESLLARLAASALAALVCYGGVYVLAGQTVFLISRQSGIPDAASVDPARTQALVTILVGLGLAMVAVFRIEVYHRKMIGSPAAVEEDEWKLEEPGAIKRR
jgi:hypothetical protein